MMTEDHLAELDEQDRADALLLKPPVHLKAVTAEDVPEAMAWPFIEADGSRGRLILAMSGWGYEIWDANDLIRFADKVRSLHLGEDTLLGGMAFVFSDMLRLIEHDGPRATLAATLGAMFMVVIVVGFQRYAVITLICGLAGTVLMLALGSLIGIRVNFLDFVALPITIGIGIDYAVNICARDKVDGRGNAKRVLNTAGGAVFLSSYTTIVGYGSLLLSANKGIRSFGEAAILGEITCLVTALIWAPALLQVWAEHKRNKNEEQTGHHPTPQH
jgi:predicted RND superfamily exporter protein